MIFINKINDLKNCLWYLHWQRLIFRVTCGKVKRFLTSNQAVDIHIKPPIDIDINENPKNNKLNNIQARKKFMISWHRNLNKRNYPRRTRPCL